MAERHALGDAVGIGGIQQFRLAEVAAPFRQLGLSQMAQPRVTTQDFAGGRDLEPLGRGLLRFDTFWATHIKILIQLQKSMNYTWRVSAWQARFFIFWLGHSGRPGKSRGGDGAAADGREAGINN
jgi:hypothetical protein